MIGIVLLRILLAEGDVDCAEEGTFFKPSDDLFNSVIFRTDIPTKAPTDKRRGFPGEKKKYDASLLAIMDYVTLNVPAKMKLSDTGTKCSDDLTTLAR